MSSAVSLAELITALEPEGDRIAGHIPASWMQGRTAFGGITAALALAAVRKHLPDLAILRSAQFSFMRPVSEHVSFHVDLVRAGRTSSFVSVDCESSGAVGARASFVFGAPRQSRHTHAHGDNPERPGPDQSIAFGRHDGGPDFLENFELRRADGDPLVSGSSRPEYTVWCRLCDSTGVPPDVALICIADCLPPAAMVGFQEPAPVSSITWAIDFARIPDRCDWVMIRTASKQAADGYSVQDMELRDTDRRLVASAQQLVALFD